MLQVVELILEHGFVLLFCEHGLVVLAKALPEPVALDDAGRDGVDANVGPHDPSERNGHVNDRSLGGAVGNAAAHSGKTRDA